MKYKFYVPAHGETIEDAVDVHRKRFDYNKNKMVDDYEYFVNESIENVAEDAAEILHESLCGEWSEGTRTIVVVSADGKEETFDVGIEYSPTFGAVKK